MGCSVLDIRWWALKRDWRSGRAEGHDLREFLDACAAPTTTYNLNRLLVCVNLDEGLPVLLADLDEFWPARLSPAEAEQHWRTYVKRRGPTEVCELAELMGQPQLRRLA
jgi:hypothetical protein